MAARIARTSREEEYDRVIETLQPRIKNVLDSINDREARDVEKWMVLDLMNEYQSKITKKANVKENDKKIMVMVDK